MIEVLGRDPGAGTYRIAARGRVASIPESLMTAGPDGLAGGRGHAAAYAWIARNAARIEAAIDSKTAGAPVAGPLNHLSLEEDH